MKYLPHYSSGPPVNKAMLLEQQKKKAMEMEQRRKAVYENNGFERNENHTSSKPENAITMPVATTAVEQVMTPEPSTEEDTKQIQNTDGSRL